MRCNARQVVPSGGVRPLSTHLARLMLQSVEICQRQCLPWLHGVQVVHFHCHLVGEDVLQRYGQEEDAPAELQYKSTVN